MGNAKPFFWGGEEGGGPTKEMFVTPFFSLKHLKVEGVWKLVGGWTNAFEQYDRQMGWFPHVGRGEHDKNSGETSQTSNGLL